MFDYGDVRFFYFSGNVSIVNRGAGAIEKFDYLVIGSIEFDDRLVKNDRRNELYRLVRFISKSIGWIGVKSRALKN